MPRYTEKLERLKLDCIPIRGLVAFPGMPLSFEISGGTLSKICENANKEGRQVFFVTQCTPEAKPHSIEDIYKVGITAKIKQIIKLPEGNVRLIIDGLSRASIVEAEFNGERITVDVLCKTVMVDDNGGVKGEALIQEVHDILDDFVGLLPKFSPEFLVTAKALRDPALVADFIACNILIRYEDKQQVLEEYDPLRRLELLAVLMSQEAEIVRAESEINRKVHEQLDRNQRDYFLREQLKVIQNELNDTGSSNLGDFGDEELDEYFDRIVGSDFPEDIKDRLIKEVHKLSKTPYASAESSVIRSYLDTCLEIPWTKLSKTRTDVATARKVLDRDHDGLEKVKERILEFIAVRQLTPEIKSQIICLVGPPGTGKTSVARSIAAAMHRKYVRVSLGGIRDEADIRGHRKTYIGSMPGRIITALTQAGVRNPVILLDEVDKMTSDAHGDPSSALLEVLDSEQNKAFRDHFVELPIDLSECVFIATANTLETVSRPLIDRMEVIELSSYSRNEKLSIAQNHLIPKQLKLHGLNKRLLKITDDAILDICDFYTAEAGVRNLEREIGSLCRKAAKELIENPDTKKIQIDKTLLEKYLGPHKVIPTVISEENEIGVVNGLAYTEVGGDLLKVECAVMPGNGKIELTGSLGDVMKESAHAAITYIRSHSAELNIDPDFYKTKDIHIHVPEGAVPKDGPSAGVTITTALVSELSSTPVRRDVAMTGEITLRGRVLAIGGLKEKTMAAYKAGVTTVLIPHENTRDLAEIDKTVRENVTFIPCKTVADVLCAALIGRTELPVSCADQYCKSSSESEDNLNCIIPESPKTENAPVSTGH